MSEVGGGADDGDGEAVGREFRDEDWYGEDLGPIRFVDCGLQAARLEPRRVHAAADEGGRWRGVTIRGTNPSGLDLSRLDLAGTGALAEQHGAEVDAG